MIEEAHFIPNLVFSLSFFYSVGQKIGVLGVSKDHANYLPLPVV
jgi:hypothetical protein